MIGNLQTNQLILASTSTARRELLNALKLPYKAVAPEVDEEVPEGTPPHRAVALLAERKARAVASRFPHSLVIGSDQLVSLSGKPFGKPQDATAARQQLESLRGRAHEIFTGVCVTGPGFEITEVDEAKLTVWPLSDEELDGYVATGEWQGCAGGYRVEARGQALFERIEGDRTAIQGLPMQRVIRILRQAGVRVF